MFNLSVIGSLAAGAGAVPEQVISSGQIFNLIGGLVLVLMIFFAVAYLLKRLSGASGVGRGYLQVIDSLHLGARERIVLVKVADIYMLVGISAGNINPLHVITGEIPEKPGEQQPGAGSRFHDLLQLAKFNSR